MHITEEAAWRDTKKIPFFRGQREEKTSALSDGGRQREIQWDEEGWKGKEIYWVRVRGEGLLVSGIKKILDRKSEKASGKSLFFLTAKGERSGKREETLRDSQLT